MQTKHDLNAVYYTYFPDPTKVDVFLLSLSLPP